MELYKKLLTNILAKEEINIVFPNLKIDINKLIELEAYKALKKIKAIIHDDNLDDKECFFKLKKLFVFLNRLVAMVEIDTTSKRLIMQQNRPKHIGRFFNCYSFIILKFSTFYCRMFKL